MEIFAGFVYGVVHAVLPGSYIINPIQGLLDYPIAFGALGLAGLFTKVRTAGPIAGTTLGVIGRFACSFLSGSIVFRSGPIFNRRNRCIRDLQCGTYLIPEFVITVFVLYVLLGTRLLHIYE